MDTTWFPFDEQLCTLVYEPWKYKAHEVNVTLNYDKEAIVDYDPQPNALWEFMGKYFLCKNYAAMSSNYDLEHCSIAPVSTPWAIKKGATFIFTITLANVDRFQ